MRSVQASDSARFVRATVAILGRCGVGLGEHLIKTKGRGLSPDFGDAVAWDSCRTGDRSFPIRSSQAVGSAQAEDVPNRVSEHIKRIPLEVICVWYVCKKKLRVMLMLLGIRRYRVLEVDLYMVVSTFSRSHSGSRVEQTVLRVAMRGGGTQAERFSP